MVQGEKLDLFLVRDTIPRKRDTIIQHINIVHSKVCHN